MIEEEGSDRASELWNSVYQPASSILAYPESRAALASARRGGRLSERAYTDSIADLESRFEELLLVGVDLELARVAGVKAELFGLRGYDAVHLASASGLGPGETTLITWDEDLAGAAVSTGLAVAGAPSG